MSKPVARDFYRAIDGAPTDRSRRGWQRLTDPATLVAGDLFAWLKPELFKARHNTGHVGFVLGEPWRDPKHAGIWLMRIGEGQDPETFVRTPIVFGRLFR